MTEFEEELLRVLQGIDSSLEMIEGELREGFERLGGAITHVASEGVNITADVYIKDKWEGV